MESKQLSSHRQQALLLEEYKASFESILTQLSWFGTEGKLEAFLNGKSKKGAQVSLGTSRVEATFAISSRVGFESSQNLLLRVIWFRVESEYIYSSRVTEISSRVE